MRRLVPALLCGALLAWGCDEPDEIYEELPENYNPTAANGQAPVGDHFEGDKGFEDSSGEYDPSLPTVEVCSDAEIAERWAWMVNQPIIPMVGAGGLDMRGGDDWSGLTIDEAQSPDMLCQASYYADGIAAWGDYYELIAVWDTETRQIDDILVTPGYKGVIDAGEFVFEVNEPITRDGVPLTRNDGSSRDPKTDENMRAMDRALIRAFRPELNADEIDCIEAGSCYILASGTVRFLVFISVGLYVPLEPVQQHIVDLETALKRPFRIGTGEAEVVGLTPTIFGTSAAGIPDCEITYGTDWADIEANCLADDPLAMADVLTFYGRQYVVVGLGGVLLYFERPGLPIDEVLPLDPTPQAGDSVAILSLNAGYEGDFSMPYSDILRIFADNLDAAIRAEVPDLPPEDPTGAEMLRAPDDPYLPAEVTERYPDRLRPGGIFAVFCEDDGDDADDLYDSCLTDSSGRPNLPLTATLKSLVSSNLGTLVTAKLTDPSFYVQQFERAVGEYFNEGPLLGDQINFTASGDTIYGTIAIPRSDDTYTVLVTYTGNDDRIHFMNFQKGVTRMEEVLLRDAALPTQTDPNPSGVFTFEHLLGSPRLGLGATGTVTVEELVPETRRALLNVQMGTNETMTILAPYQEASSVTGYLIPTEGPASHFEPAHWFALTGGVMGAGFYLAEADDGSGDLEIVGITGSSFFGDVSFCGLPVRIGDFADDLLDEIEANGYPCDLIVRLSENREFVTSLADLDSQIKVYVDNNVINQVFRWAR